MDQAEHGTPHPKASPRDARTRSRSSSSSQKQGQPSCSRQSEELEAPKTPEQKERTSRRVVDTPSPVPFEWSHRFIDRQRSVRWASDAESVKRKERRPSRWRAPPDLPPPSFETPEHRESICPPDVSSWMLPEPGRPAAQDKPPSDPGDSSGSDQKQGQPSCSRQQEELEESPKTLPRRPTSPSRPWEPKIMYTEEKCRRPQQEAVDELPWEERQTRETSPESFERKERKPSRSRTPPARPAPSFQTPQHPRILSEPCRSAAKDELPSVSGDSSGSDATSEVPRCPGSSRFGVDEVESNRRGPTQASGQSFGMCFGEIVVAP